ncbi:MAG: response regulator transcription factor [Bacteroidales bacterium]|jgi:DNA-binding response OmpR family regulator|nr:response regulator transcription factor [Bacteroidales bacterium]
MKLLIVEDNYQLANDLARFLSENGFIVEIANNLRTAKDKVGVYDYDLIILDLGLPDGNGLDLIHELKHIKRDPGILIVTAKNAVEDKVMGLELGADDFITKPFHKAELNARVRSIIRRKNFKGNSIIEINQIKIDLDSREAFVNENLVELTRKEYDLLLYFMYNKGRVLTKENIAEHLWGDHIDQADNFDFIYNHIKNLRKKLQVFGAENNIRSVYGMGYKFFEL